VVSGQMCPLNPLLLEADTTLKLASNTD